MASQFADYYKQSAAVHEAILDCLSRSLGGPLDVAEIIQCVHEKYPDLGLPQAELAEMIVRAAEAGGVQLLHQPASEGSVIST